MFGSVVLEVALGLLVVYAWFSLACSAMVEYLESLRAQRGRLLAIAIERMLGAELKTEFYQHGLVQSQGKSGRLPSYLPASTFSTVLLDLLRVNPTEFRQQLAQAPGALGQTLRALTKNVTSAEHATLLIEQWFEHTMDRCSGWYQRRTRIVSFLSGLTVAALLNVYSLEIASALYSDAHLRLSVAMQSDAEGQVPIGRRAADKAPSVMNIPIESGTLPLGWENSHFAAKAQWADHAWSQPGFWFGPVLSKILGLLVTALAGSLGAAFWFDALRRLLALRPSVAWKGQTLAAGGSTAIVSAVVPPPGSIASVDIATVPPSTASLIGTDGPLAPLLDQQGGIDRKPGA